MTDGNAVTFQFYMFGPPQLCIDGDPVSLPPQPAAFCSFLILNRQRRITREEIQVAFWPDASPPRAQERLRRTLYLLRRSIEPHTHLIAAEGAEVAIAPGVSLWVDYEAFEQALLDAYRNEVPRRDVLERAVGLYSDDLLRDIYADWVLLEREHARQQFLTALRQVMSLSQNQGDWAKVTHYAHVLLEHDPYQELAHRALMRAFAVTGDRSAALRQYQQCADILQRELGADPLDETIQLYDDIRQGRGVVAEDVAVIAAPVMVTSAADLQSLPLIGREQELSAIAGQWHTCKGGQSRLVLVTGPAGMGKTRLVNEASHRIPGAEVSTLTGHCYAMEAGTPYQLIADLMRVAVERVRDQLDATTCADLVQIVPALRDDFPDLLAEPVSAGVDISLRVQEAVTTVIRLIAERGDGLWIIAEDLHWADPASLAVLNHVMRRCSDLPLLVLATLRDEEVSFDSPLMDWPAASVQAPAPGTMIQLPPLQSDQLSDLVLRVVGQDSTPLATLLEYEAAGNPFFIVETLRALAEQGVIYAESGAGWRLRPDVLPRPATLPMSDVVLRVIRGRIRRLSRAAQEVLTIGAVIEHDIKERMVERLVDAGVALDLALDEALQTYIIKETKPGIYQFTHIKVREILYADTSAPRKRFLHRRIADLLAASASHDQLSDVAPLVYHYTQARDWTQALIYGWRAAQTAWAAGAFVESYRYAVNVQQILDDYAGDIDAALLPEPLPAIRFDVLWLHAEFLRQATSAGMYYPPDVIAAIQALVPDLDESRRAQASLQQATHWLGHGELTNARDAAAHGRVLFAQLGDLRGELSAIQHQFDIAFRAGDMVAARALIAELRGLSAEIGRGDVARMLAHNEMVLAVYHADWSHVLAQATLLSTSEEITDPAVAWLRLTNLGLAYLKLGLLDEARDTARRAVAMCDDAGALGLGARVLMSRVELRRGKLDQAHAILTGLLDDPDPLVGEGELVAPALAMVRCCVLEGNHDTAEKWSKWASGAASSVKLPLVYPLSQVAWVLTHLAAGRYDDAQKRLRYPLEHMALLADTSAQEILALRAAAAQGLGDKIAAQEWLAQAHAVMLEQAAGISDAGHRASFLENIPLHRVIMRAIQGAKWLPSDMLHS